MFKPCSIHDPPLQPFPIQPEREAETDDECMDKLSTQKEGVGRPNTVAHLTQVFQHLDLTDWTDNEAPIQALLF